MSARGGGDLASFLADSQLLEWGQAHSRCSVNICLASGWILLWTCFSSPSVYWGWGTPACSHSTSGQLRDDHMGQWIRRGLYEIHLLLGWLSPGKGLPNRETSTGDNGA